jgi:hypothetical protein
VEKRISEIQNKVIKTASEHIKEQRVRNRNTKLVAYCITILLAVSIVCGTVLACYTVKQQHDTIIEQQYALNIQYASLMEYVSGAEITTTYEANSGKNGTAIVGDGNTLAGGDANGDG